MGFFWNNLFFVPVIAWLASVAIKGLVLYYQKKFDIHGMFGSGGMPSVHSALVTSLTTSVGIKYSITSDLFLICLVFSCIIIYDAINVRFEAGQHAKALNKLTHKEEYTFNESIGHLPKEAFVGSCIGILTAMVLLGF